MLDKPSLSQNFLQDSSPSQEQSPTLEHRLPENLSTEATSLIEKSQPKQIVFIDSLVEDYKSLAVSVEPGTEVVILDSKRNGVEQITETLKRYANLSSIIKVSDSLARAAALQNRA